MEVYLGAKDGQPVKSPEERLAGFQTDMAGRLPEWRQRLGDDPACLRTIEEEIDQACREGAGQAVAGLLAQVTSEDTVQQRVEQIRQRAVRPFRKQLRRGQYQQVVQRLQAMAQDAGPDSDVHREIRYLQKHGQSGHLRYPTFRPRGLPLGSGAIQSSVRRAINLRLKGNAIYWADEGVEALLVLPATLLSDRWEESLATVQASMLHDRHIDWRWEAPDLSKRHLKATNAKHGHR